MHCFICVLYYAVYISRSGGELVITMLAERSSCNNITLALISTFVTCSYSTLPASGIVQHSSSIVQHSSGIVQISSSTSNETKKSKFYLHILYTIYKYLNVKCFFSAPLNWCNVIVIPKKRTLYSHILSGVQVPATVRQSRPYFCISSPCGSSIALCALIMVIMTLEAIPWSTLVPIAFLSPEWLFQLITTSLIPLEMTKKYSENGITQNFLCFPEPIPIYTLVPSSHQCTDSITYWWFGSIETQWAWLWLMPTDVVNEFHSLNAHLPR